MFGYCSLLSILGLIFLASLLGCNSTRDDKVNTSPEILARVGDREITVANLERALELLYPPGRTPPASVERKVLQRLIDAELICIGAKDKGLESDWQVANTVQQKKEELLLDELYRRGILKITGEVSEEEARAYFERFSVSEERLLSRILLSSPIAAVQTLRHLAAGEDFAALARQVSEDPQTALNGGEMGWRNRLDIRNSRLRHPIFGAAVGEVVGPLQMVDGYALIKIMDLRQVSYESVAAKVEQAVLEQKRTLTTGRFLEDLADRAGVREDSTALQLLLLRLSEAGRDVPQLKKREGRKVLLRAGRKQWTLDQFMAAMLTERDQAEIRKLADLRYYVRRLFALKELLHQRAAELGLQDSEHVRKETDKALREALMDRLRQVEVDERIDPAEEEVRAYYQRHKDRFEISERIHIMEIFVSTRQEAEATLQEIAAGEEMEEVVRRYSVRSSRIRRSGGRIQLMRPEMYGNVGLAAQEAEVGELVGPVKTAQGYSVFKVLKKIPAQPLSFEEAKGRAAEHLRKELSKQGFEALLRQLNSRYRDLVRIYEGHFEDYLKSRDKA